MSCLFEKYPFIESIAWSGSGEPLVNGFELSDVSYRGLVNWSVKARPAFAEVQMELEARGVLLPQFVIWRDWITEAQR